MYVTTSILNVIEGNIVIAFALSISIGVALGFINAIVITYFKIPTLITTLGTMNIFHGMLLVIGRTAHIAKIPACIVRFGEASVFRLSGNANIQSGLSYLSILMIFIFAATWVILKYTRMGRGVYAIGSNVEAARRVGFNVNAIQIFVYCYIGMLSGIAGLVDVSLVRYVNSFDLVGTELGIIGAVALGGASISGGRGTVLGTALGAALLLVIKNCLVLIGIPSSWQAFIVRNHHIAEHQPRPCAERAKRQLEMEKKNPLRPSDTRLFGFAFVIILTASVLSLLNSSRFLSLGNFR